MSVPSPRPLIRAELPGLELLHRGKVRDLFALDGSLLMVASDRISAFDVVLPDALPRKGEVLNRISNFWFEHFSDVRNHKITIDLAEMPEPLPSHPELAGRSMLCRRVQPVMAEFVVRGYLAGSAWKDYQRTGAVCGIALPAGMQLGQPFPEPLFTPSTKAPAGEHDENISYAQLCDHLGHERAATCRDLVLRLYREAHAYAAERGILLADTKVELGEDAHGILVIDELFTPDSSRFWPADGHQVGQNPSSYDKQIIRDWLEQTDWDKKAPGPRLDPAVLQRAQSAYLEIFERLTGSPLPAPSG